MPILMTNDKEILQAIGIAIAESKKMPYHHFERLSQEQREAVVAMLILNTLRSIVEARLMREAA